jgi:type II secretory pathway pseudopilin PulG
MIKEQTSLSINRHLPLKKGEVFDGGFTLIEIIVVVASTALLMTAIAGITLGIFKSQNRNDATNKVVQNGNFILNELRNDILNSGNGNITCINNNSIGITNSNDGGSTVISCNTVTNNIASTSGSVQNLNNSDGNVIDCTSSFVSCVTLPSLQISNVKFNFGIGATTAGVGTTQYFSIDVSVRN